MSVSLYVGNLSYTADESSLKSLFAPFGEVISARVMTDRDTGRSRGFGFVEMDAAQAAQAISSLNGKDHEGRALRVNEAEKRSPRG